MGKGRELVRGSLTRSGFCGRLLTRTLPSRSQVATRLPSGDTHRAVMMLQKWPSRNASPPGASPCTTPPNNAAGASPAAAPPAMDEPLQRCQPGRCCRNSLAGMEGCQPPHSPQPRLQQCQLLSAAMLDGWSVLGSNDRSCVPHQGSGPIPFCMPCLFTRCSRLCMTGHCWQGSYVRANPGFWR